MKSEAGVESITAGVFQKDERKNQKKKKNIILAAIRELHTISVGIITFHGWDCGRPPVYYTCIELGNGSHHTN